MIPKIFREFTGGSMKSIKERLLYQIKQHEEAVARWSAEQNQTDWHEGYTAGVEETIKAIKPIVLELP